MTEQERKASCERTIQAALSQFNCVLIPTIATDGQGNLFRDQMGIRLIVLPAKETVAPEQSQADATGLVDPAAVASESVLPAVLNVAKKKYKRVVPNGAKVDAE